MLITEEYRKEQEKLHAKGNYGVTAGKYAPMVAEMITRLEVAHLLDYGCGSNVSLGKGLKDIGFEADFTYQCYDPGVPEYSGEPAPADLVVCCDVLEHIEPTLLEDVLDNLADLTEVAGFFSIHTGPAGKFLSDGRNAHLIQKPYQWWLPKIWDRFEIQSFQVVSPVEFFVIVHNADLELQA